MKTPTAMYAAIASMCAALTLPASATLVMVTGNLIRVDTGLTSEFQVGQSYAWTYEFDPGAQDFNATPTRGDYRGSISTGRLAIGGYVATSTGGTIVVDNGLFGSGFDRYSVEIDDWNGTVTGPLVNGRFPYAIGLELNDATDAALTNDLLATALPTVTDFASREFVFSFAQSIFPTHAFDVQRAYGTVESITEVRELPEPSTALLVLSGLLAAFSGLPTWGRGHAPKKRRYGGIPAAP